MLWKCEWQINRLLSMTLPVMQVMMLDSLVIRMKCLSVVYLFLYFM